MTHHIPFADLKKNDYSEESRKIIDGWQDRAIELAEQEDFRKHVVTIKLAQEAKNMISAIETILKDQEDLVEAERKALFKEKKVHQFYLALFERSGAEELEQIAKHVQEELPN